MRRMPFVMCCFALAAICSSVFMIELDAAKRSARRSGGIITRPKFDPDAEKLEFFKGQKEGRIGVKVIPRDEKGGNVLVENTTDQPLSIQVPRAIVGVHVLNQFGGGGGGMGAMGGGMMGGGGGMMGGGQMGGGGGQSMGGGMGGGMMGGGGGMMGGGQMGGGMGGGGGFFSIPPQQTVRVQYGSVCLNHGLPVPRPSANYQLMPPEQYTSDANLQELLYIVASGKIDQKSAQAAAWHLTDKMSWQELANKTIKRLGGLPPQRYFTLLELRRAQLAVSVAVDQAGKRKPTSPNLKDAYGSSGAVGAE
ncbi:MAG: hypothetical protein O3A00_12965 [Planctomycetota bacterium]|nr:hypothetical protein [Planctomycetota bacterium]